MTADEPQPKKRGPKPERLKAEGAGWEDAVSHALHKKKPKKGWPGKKAKHHKKGRPDDQIQDT